MVEIKNSSASFKDVPDKLAKPLSCNKCNLTNIKDVATLRIHQIETHDKLTYTKIDASENKLKRTNNTQNEEKSDSLTKKLKVTSEESSEESRIEKINEMLEKLSEEELGEYNFENIDEKAILERTKALFLKQDPSNKCKLNNNQLLFIKHKLSFSLMSLK
jgi:hypothetical protein